MKRKIFWLSSLVTTAASLATTIFGIALTNRIMYIKKKDEKFIYERELKANRLNEEWYNNCNKDELTIDSPNGYTIKGVFLKPHQTKNTVIVCHGVTENKISSLKYARMFEKLGFNTFVFDHRRHGESGGKTTSYGYYEKYDLQAVVSTVKSLVGEDAIIGIQGESMGAATTILYAGTVSDNADFYIADCSFSDFHQLLYYLMTNTTLLRTSIPIHLADMFLRVRDGYRFRNIAPKDAIKNIEKPMLFIHSLPDTFIPADMTKELYEFKRGVKQLKLFETGTHANSYNENPEEYEQVVKSFLEEYVLPSTPEVIDETA